MSPVGPAKYLPCSSSYLSGRSPTRARSALLGGGCTNGRSCNGQEKQFAPGALGELCSSSTFVEEDKASFSMARIKLTLPPLQPYRSYPLADSTSEGGSRSSRE